MKRLRQRQSEEPNSRVQIQCQRAMRICRDSLQQIIDQEAIHLKKRKMADAEFVSARFVRQVPRPCQFKPVLLLVQQQQTFDPGQCFSKRGCQLRGWHGKFLERNVQRNFVVNRIGKGFYLLDTLR